MSAAASEEQYDETLIERLKSPDEAVVRQAIEEVKRTVENVDGATLALMAYRLFHLGARDEAVFWFYAGQLRLRYYLGTYSGDPSAQGILDGIVEAFGPEINGYAFGDIPQLAKTLDDVLAWDLKTPNNVHPPAGEAIPESEWPRVRKEIREGLLALRQQLLEQADEIRSGRRERGLE